MINKMGLQHSTQRETRTDTDRTDKDDSMVSKIFVTSIKKKKVSPKKKKMNSPVNKKKVSSTPGLTLVPDAETKAGVGYWDEKNVRLRKEKKRKREKEKK